MTWGNATENYSSDYNGYRPNALVGKGQYRWLAPKKKGETVYEPAASDWREFASLAEMSKATGQETHGVELDYDVFEDLEMPDPRDRHRVYHAMDLSFALKPGGDAVDRGVALPTINDDHTGDAPDLGALEVGKPEPRYGARWITWKPFYR